jgi:hypothetical protein
MIEDNDFHELCTSFEKEIENYDSEMFRPETDTVISLGNQQWQVNIFCNDSSLEDPSWPLVVLFRTRRDLVYPIVQSTKFREFLRGAHMLAEWLENQGYAVSLEAKTPIGRAKLGLFNTFVNVFAFFNPHER